MNDASDSVTYTTQGYGLTLTIDANDHKTHVETHLRYARHLAESIAKTKERGGARPIKSGV